VDKPYAMENHKNGAAVGGGAVITLAIDCSLDLSPDEQHHTNAAAAVAAAAAAAAATGDASA